ncbi:hypothetical protein KC906_00905 [Candidatus Kaiserbacteria bacterium]|nr:hypothetical protein [Candidatus Kaiserbacteria bacterium]
MNPTVRVDQINLALLGFSFVVAWLVPFELLLFSYAFLGPLHYLTEISWLHDRKYFTLLPEDPWYLIAGSLFLLYSGVALFPSAAELVWILLLLAFCTAFVRSLWKRLFILAGGIVLLVPWMGSSLSYAGALLIPTIAHVYLFTILFMWFGALKSKSKLGHYNAALSLLGGVALLLLPGAREYLWPEFLGADRILVDGILVAFSSILAVSMDTLLTTIAPFLAFVYTYHYLNWFSKTSIIEWHQVSWQRAMLIGCLYAVAVGVYLIDYQTGFIVLLSLSFLHVVLEFPLNFKSIVGIYSSLRKS